MMRGFSFDVPVAQHLVRFREIMDMAYSCLFSLGPKACDKRQTGPHPMPNQRYIPQEEKPTEKIHNVKQHTYNINKKGNNTKSSQNDEAIDQN